MGTAEFHHQVGKYLYGRAKSLGRPANSLLAAAYEAACRSTRRAPATARSA